MRQECQRRCENDVPTQRRIALAKKLEIHAEYQGGECQGDEIGGQQGQLLQAF